MTTLDWNPSPQKLRQFGAVASVALAIVAMLAHRRGGGWLAVWVPLALAGMVAIIAAARPARLRLLYVVLTLIVLPVGLVVSNVVLLAVFYGVITPLALVGRLVRSDPLDVRRRVAAPTYWRARRATPAKSSYLRQA